MLGTPNKWRPYWICGHKMAKKPRTGKVHSKFQFPSMFSVQMNVPFVSFQYRDLKVLRLLYYCIYRQISIFEKL